MRRFLTLTIALLFIVTVANSQTCKSYYPQEVGKTYVYTSYDKKDKVTSKEEKTVKEKKEIPGGLEVKISDKSINEKEGTSSTREYTIKCENGNFTMDMESFLNQEQMEAYKDMEVDVTADNLTIPANAKVGDKLNSGKVVADISNNGVKMMSMTVNISNRKVEAEETITTDAGTFKCLKITSDVELRMLLVIRTTLTEWYTKDIGVVKSESKSKRGKILGKTILTGIK